jgi:hypothetical protein
MPYSKFLSGRGAFTIGIVTDGCCGLMTGPLPTGLAPMTFSFALFGRSPVSIWPVLLAEIRVGVSG